MLELQRCSVCDGPTGHCNEDAIWSADGLPLCGDCKKETYCSLCDEPGADKIPHPVYWPGEEVPESKYVHAECEAKECLRACEALTESERQSFLDSVIRG